MKITRGASNSARKSSRPETRIVMVSEFVLDESGKAIGVKGVSYPGKEEIEVTLTSTGTKAENSSRKDFEAYRKGFKGPNGNRVAFEPGAILRLNCMQTGVNSFEADWINVLAANGEAAKQSMHFGYAAVELFTPEPVKEKYREIAAKMKEDNPNVSKYEIENALLDNIKGERRYNGNALLYHPREIKEANGETLQETLADYYGSKKFEKVANESGDKFYEPVSPGMIIRALNAEGAVLSALDVTGAMLYKAKAETPEERAAYAASMTGQMASDDVSSYSLLPYDRVRLSEISLTVKPQTTAGIKTLARVQSMSFERVTDESGETGYENRAVQAAIKSAGNGMISELAVPADAKSVDVALLAEDGSEMREATRQDDEASDDNSPGM